jgi:broad specificity phosphatase PhoE
VNDSERTAEEQTQQQSEERIEARAARQRVPSAIDMAFLTGAENVTELLLIRHGQQDYNPNGTAGDWVDPPLSELGRQQAKLVGMALSTEKIDAVYVSPLKRAFDTGHEIARHHRIEPEVVLDLREVEVFRDLPRDKTPLEVMGKQALAGTRQRFVYEKNWDVYPFSEPSFEFRRRIINSIEGIIATHPNERVVIACHGGVINVFVGHVIGSRYDMFFRPAHTSINVVAAGGGIRALYRLNDVHHLHTAEGSFHSL